MPLPVILGLLAAAGLGAGAGTAHRKLAESRQQDDLLRDIMLKTALGGGEIPTDQAKKLFGDKAEILPFLSKAIQANQQRQFGMAQGALNEEGPSPFGGPTQSGGAALTQPDPRQVPGDQPGSPAMPWHPPMLPPAAEAPPIPSSGMEGGLAPAQAPPQRTFRARPGVSVDMPGGMRFSTPGIGAPQAAEANRQGFTFQQHRDLESLMSQATRTGMPYNEFVKQMDARGLGQSPQAKDMAERYGQTMRDQAERTAYQQIVGNDRRPLSPVESNQVAWQGWFNSGYGKPPASDQGTVDQQYLKAVQSSMLSNPNVPFAAIDSAVRGMGIVPSQQAVAQMAEYAKSAAERQALAANPALANNPNALQAEVIKRMGSMGINEAERGRANEPAKLPPGVQERLGEQGVPPVRAAQLGGSQAALGTQPPGTVFPLEQVRKEVEAADVAKAAKQAAATAEGSKRGAVAGEEGSRLIKTLTPKERQGFVDPDTLQNPPEGTKVGAVQPDTSKYASFTGTPKDLHDLTRLREVVSKYKDALTTLKPLMEKGSLLTAAQSLAIVGRDGLRIPLTNIKVGSVMPGALPDEQSLKILQQQTGLSKPEAEKVARAMVTLQIQQDTALSILRTFFNEKGNVRGDLIASGAKALPHLENNWLTASQKYSDFLDFVEAWERGFGLPGRKKKAE